MIQIKPLIWPRLDLPIESLHFTEGLFDLKVGGGVGYTIPLYFIKETQSRQESFVFVFRFLVFLGFFLSFCHFLGLSCSIWNFPGWGSNLSFSC